MWKKQILPGARNTLGSKDRKKLAKQLSDAYPLFDESDAILKNFQLSVLKVKGAKSLIYLTEQGIPLFFDADADGDLYPTIHWFTTDEKFQPQKIAPCFVVPPEVSTFILGGADLMSPGVYQPANGQEATAYPPAGLQKAARFFVRVAGNPIPFAVGKCLLGSSGNADDDFGPSLDDAAVAVASESSAGKFKGRALAVVHYFNDFLYNLGGGGQHPPGFGQKIISSVDGFSEDHLVYPQLIPKATKEESDLTREPETSQEGLDEGLDEGISTSIAAPDCPPELMETFMEFCFLQVLHVDALDEKLPMSFSTIYERMISAAPAVQFSLQFRKYLMENAAIAEDLANGIADGEIVLPLDVKITSYKKIARFFQHWAKKVKGVTVKEIRGTQVIFDVDRTNEKYRSWAPLTENDKKHATKMLASSSAVTTPVEPVTASENRFRVLEFLAPQGSAVSVFEIAEIGPDVQQKYYTMSRVVLALSAYIKKCNLQLPENKQMVALDSLLKSCCQNETSPLPYATLHQLFESRMKPFFAIVRPNQDELSALQIQSGKFPCVLIYTEKRRNKTQTIIVNIHYFLPAKEVAEILQKEFAASASTFEIQSIAGKSKPLGVSVQGSWMKEAAHFLETAHGIPKKCIKLKT